MDPDQIKKIIKGLSLLGEVYIHCRQNEFKRFGNIEKDWRDALKFFLKHYAFERQGAPKAYPDSAVESFDKIAANCPGKELAEKVWKEFREDLNGDLKKKKIGLNEKNNPLFFEDNPGKEKDVITFCEKIEMDYKYNIFQFAKKGFEDNGKYLKDTHDSFKKIRGIGDKIASFFLRDVAFLDKNISINELEKLQDRWLLQPVDLWIKRTVSFLDGPNEQENKEIAKRLVEMADDAQCCALSLNAGAWYLGAEIATTERRFEDCLKNVGGLKKNIEKWLSPRQEETKKLSDVFDKIKEI